MNDICATVRVQPWSDDQGDFVTINKSDFDDKKHKLYEGKTPSAPPPAAPTKPSYSDAVLKKAEALGVDLEKVTGTGSGGNVVVKDVEAFAEANQEPTIEVDFASEEAGELAAELGFDAEKLQDLEGTGKDGAITVEDLEKFADEQTSGDE